MPPKKTEAKSTRRTAAIQIDKDLARMAAVIASHRRVSQADLVSPVLRQFLQAQYALVSAEIQKEVKSGSAGKGKTVDHAELYERGTKAPIL